MGTFLRPPFVIYRRMNLIYACTRQFKTRTGPQSIGLGSSKFGEPGYEAKLSKLYNDDKVQRLWNNTYERITSSAQAARSSQSYDQQDTSFSDYRDLQQQRQSSSSFASNANGSQQLGDIKQHNKPESILGTIAGSQLDEERKMKISFAEGYFHGMESGSKKPKYRIFALMRDSIIIVLIATAALTLFSGENPFRKVILGKSTFEVVPEEIDVTFTDVLGCDESKQELADIVEYLKRPNKYTRLGGKLPKGVLLVGPPGTGKTLLARAVAGEAGVPFFHASGSEFDEILVGQGARRVRDLFERAKQRAPCVVFIDEIDSIGGKRTSSVLHPYANQTINQLLSEMDGFSQNEGVIVLGATNRADDLDKALLRPGRFDVQVTVAVPDYGGRLELFEYYLRGVRASLNIDLDVLCRSTVNFTGADIKNLVNQAALKAATENMEFVTQEMLEYSRDKILMGPERRSRIPDEDQNLMTAYHEAGHALVAYYTEKANKLHKVTIISRNSSLGHTLTLPERDQYSQTKQQLSANMDVALGGRVAEEMIFGDDRVTTGCGQDLTSANRLASHMVKDLGMSEKIGVRVIREEPSGSQIVVNNLGDATSELVESEISRLLIESKTRVKELLTSHRNELKLLAEALMKYDTLDAAEVEMVLKGKDPRLAKMEFERDRKNKVSNLKPGTPRDRLPLDLLK